MSNNWLLANLFFYMKKIVITSIIVALLIIGGTTLAILYAKGYRLQLQNGKTIVAGTGILTVNSSPQGAKVYIDGNLTTATNNQLNLAPGTYKVRIEKEGYFAWEKTLTIKKELVTEADALLFPTTPKFEPITISGVNNLATDTSGTVFAYTVASASAQTDGVYILDMNSRPFFPTSGLTSQIADDTVYDLSNAYLTFSPDSDQLLASTSGTLGTTYYLLSTKSMNTTPQNVTVTLPQINQAWQSEETLKVKKTTDALPKKVRPLVSEFFKDMQVSPDQSKIFYTALKDGTLPLTITPRLPDLNTTVEQRTIKAGSQYVYDMKEDRNYLIYQKKDNQRMPHFIWFPDSMHLVFVQDKQIRVIESDGLNTTTVYAGPFNDDFVAVWPDGSNLVILTNFNASTAPSNLYRISLK
jgi:hypothetical protein